MSDPEGAAFSPAAAVLHARRQAARCDLRAADGRGHRRDREGGERRPDDPLEPDQQPVRRDGLPGQPEPAERAGDQGVPDAGRRARAGRPGGRRHPRGDGPRRDRRVRRRPGCAGRSSSRPGSRRSARAGAELERQVLEQARRGRMRLIGPNCLGVMRPHSGLNATFAGADGPARQRRVPQPERRALHGDPRLEPARVNVGFSAFVSIGSMLDVGWGDLIDYLGDDPHTKCIVIYMESIGDARSFLSAAREVALTKPIIVIKAGRTEAAAKAAASHTGVADRQRRGARRRVPPRAACCASTTISERLRHGRGARQAAPAARARG